MFQYEALFYSQFENILVVQILVHYQHLAHIRRHKIWNRRWNHQNLACSSIYLISSEIMNSEFHACLSVGLTFAPFQSREGGFVHRSSFSWAPVNNFHFPNRMAALTWTPKHLLSSGPSMGSLRQRKYCQYYIEEDYSRLVSTVWRFQSLQTVWRTNTDPPLSFFQSPLGSVWFAFEAFWFDEFRSEIDSDWKPWPLKNHLSKTVSKWFVLFYIVGPTDSWFRINKRSSFPIFNGLM